MFAFIVRLVFSGNGDLEKQFAFGKYILCIIKKFVNPQYVSKKRRMFIRSTVLAKASIHISQISR